MKILLKNGKMPSVSGSTGSLLIENGKIAEIYPTDSNQTAGDDIETVDCSGLTIVPSFIDLQVNGCGGLTFNDDPCVSVLEHMLSVNHKTGTAVFLPTLVTCSDGLILKALKSIRRFHEIHGKHSIPGLHIEGPFISLEKSGIHDRRYVRALDQSTFETILEYAGELALMTVSPEQLTESQAEKLSKAGIRLSVGHSACSHELALKYLRKYFTSATHLYNAMTSVVNARTPGILCSAAEAELYAGIIADNRHVHPDLVRMAFKIFGRKLYLVTDALASAGADPDFKTFKFCGKDVYIREGGFCSDENGTLAGSSLTMNAGVRNLVRTCRIPEKNAFAMASEIPAEVIGLAETGKLCPGCSADIAILDENYEIIRTISQGMTVYQKQN